MNRKPIEQASDPALRGSLAALRRAAKRARDIAASTDTFLIVSRDGVIEYLKPEIERTAATGTQEPSPPYGDAR